MPHRLCSCALFAKYYSDIDLALTLPLDQCPAGLSNKEAMVPHHVYRSGTEQGSTVLFLQEHLVGWLFVLCR